MDEKDTKSIEKITGKILSYAIENPVIEKALDSKGQKVRKVKGYANKSTVDRGGDLVLPTAFESSKEKFLQNPVMFYNHDWTAPIGSVEVYDVRNDGLYIEGTISSGYEEADKAWAYAERGLVKSFSIGFIPKEVDYDSENDIRIIKDLEMLEVSLVTIPMNAESTFIVSKGAISSIMCGEGNGQVTYKQLISAVKEPQPEVEEPKEDNTVKTIEISFQENVSCSFCWNEGITGMNWGTAPTGCEFYICFDCFAEAHPKFYEGSGLIQECNAKVTSIEQEKSILNTQLATLTSERDVLAKKLSDTMGVIEALKKHYVNQIKELVVDIVKKKL